MFCGLYICCRHTIPSEFVTLSIVITIGHFYLVREISMGNRCCTQPRCTILSFVIDISTTAVCTYVLYVTHTHTHTYIITLVLCCVVVLLLLSSSHRARSARALVCSLLYDYYFTFAVGASDRDLCRSVNSVGGRASMSSFILCLSLTLPPPLFHHIITLSSNYFCIL